MADLATQLRHELASGTLDLPLPAAGATRARLAALRAFGERDLSLARVIEAHTDAIAILCEAQRRPERDALYGVWAAESGAPVTLCARGDGFIVEGSKRFCSGAPFLDHALITARHDASGTLVSIDLHQPGIRIESGTWRSPAFAATATSTVHFDAVRIGRESIIGSQDWYLTRPGFWHGALAPAACWAGGAIGLVDAARGVGRRDPHSLAHLGALEADAWALRAVLDQAADEIDADPEDRARSGRPRALKVRHVIERLCVDVIDHFGRMTGPHLLAFDAAVAQRHAELSLYIRQCHAERDLAEIAAD